MNVQQKTIRSNKPIKKKYKNGLIVEDITIGEGDEVTGCDTITIHYTGFIKNGKIIDSTYKRGGPMTFTLGKAAVMLGFEQGIPGMKVGGVRKLTIPADIGFGNRIMPGVPCDSDLVYEIELLDICEW